ncbi:MAG TPA: alpha/beta hydrolase [Holophagaceae bacterium]|nr:alpha/beta hydrolase [Holophagaceae bacterium]
MEYQVTANGIQLAYETFGPDHPKTILLISGLGTQMVRWSESFCHRLSDHGFRVIRFDNRDTGRSSHLTERGVPDFKAWEEMLREGMRPPVAYSLHDMSDDVIGLLDALSLDCVHVVGRSMGGMIAQILASEHPNRVASLTSIMSSTGNPELPGSDPEVFAMMTQPTPDPFMDMPNFLAHRMTFARRIAGTGFPFDEDRHREIAMEEFRRSYDPGGTLRQMAAIAVTGDRRPRLRSISAPTLIIHGSDDPLFLPACGLDSAASIPNAELMMIEGMGHDLPLDLEAPIAEAIKRIAS